MTMTDQRMREIGLHLSTRPRGTAPIVHDDPAPPPRGCDQLARDYVRTTYPSSSLRASGEIDFRFGWRAAMRESRPEREGLQRQLDQARERVSYLNSLLDDIAALPDRPSEEYGVRVKAITEGTA